MDDFRNDYNEKRRGNGWNIFLACVSIVALIFSSVALYRSNRIVSGNSTSFGGENVGIKVATTNVDSNDTGVSTNTDGVVGVAEAMKNKVVYVGVYGNSRSFSDSVQYAQIGSGSGFIVSPAGYVVTNYHVIEDGKSFKVTINSEETYDATVVGYDSYSDLAVLKIENANKQFDSVVLGDSNAVKVGELAIAIGSPLGETLNNSVTVGYISAKDREITSNAHTSTMIQTDAAVNPGNSGGPLLNSYGQVIGINTMKSTVAGYDDYGNAISADGISFAIPISDALPIITSIIQNGKYSRPGLGISY
ncbi:MAG: trypsin-like peptidase domain-containing protein, partial [Clostridia bacterium]|nr:trypsin-like peptidase domain-containing protein [Clostridia bacterium]